MMVQGRSTAGGQPLVIAEPSGAVAAAFMELGSAVVREVSKLQAAPKNSLRSAFFDFFSHQNCCNHTLNHTLKRWKTMLQLCLVIDFFKTRN